MNPFKYLKRLFSRTPTTVIKSVTEMPPVKPPEPSCFAKGIAELWKQGSGWKVSYDAKSARRLLKHAKMGVTIRVDECSICESGISKICVYVQGESKICRYGSFTGYAYGPSAEDYCVVRDAIAAHPYPALKKLVEAKAKEMKDRVAQTKAIEELGCPVTSQTVTVTEAEILRDPA